eukprot:1046739_1
MCAAERVRPLRSDTNSWYRFCKVRCESMRLSMASSDALVVSVRRSCLFCDAKIPTRPKQFTECSSNAPIRRESTDESGIPTVTLLAASSQRLRLRSGKLSQISVASLLHLVNKILIC